MSKKNLSGRYKAEKRQKEIARKKKKQEKQAKQQNKKEVPSGSELNIQDDD